MEAEKSLGLKLASWRSKRAHVYFQTESKGQNQENQHHVSQSEKAKLKGQKASIAV